MRVWIPPEAGLGAKEIYNLKRLSRPSLEIIADELTEPGSHEAVRWILQQRDPERALAKVIADSISFTVETLRANPNAGMGDLLGKSFFKKLHKIVKKVTVSIPKKIASKVANKNPIYKKLKPTLKKVANVVRKNLPIILTVAGAVLAPFTGGASLAVAAALTTARQLYVAKKAADDAKKAGKAEAAAMQAQVSQQEAEVMQQADQVYADNQDIFLAAGYDQARWNSLTLDQKIEVITAASNGTLKPTPEAVAAQQQVVDAANQAAASAGASAVTASGAQQLPRPMPQPQPYPYPQPQPPTYTSTSAAPAPAPTPAPAAAAPAPAPSVGSEQSDETAGLPSASGYTVNVEGQPITNYPVDLSTLSSIIASGTKQGDRFEIMADGRPTGLRVRTASGFISIPDSMRAQVMAMPPGQVLQMLKSAAENVAASGGPEGPDPVAEPENSGGGSWGLFAALAVGGLALASGGKKR